MFPPMYFTNELCGDGLINKQANKKPTTLQFWESEANFIVHAVTKHILMSGGAISFISLLCDLLDKILDKILGKIFSLILILNHHISRYRKVCGNTM